MHVIRTRLRQRQQREDGFTLVELVVTVAILGVVTAALFGVVLQYLKTTSDTRARLAESTDQQFISAYWQNDVSSLGRRSLVGGAVTPAPSVSLAPASGCGSAAGTVVVRFGWNEFPTGVIDPVHAWDPTPQEVAYVTASNGSRLLLKRVRCRNGVADTPQTVAHSLTGPPSIACDTTCDATPLPNRVSMTFTVRDADNPASPGYTTTVSADRRQG